MIIIKISLVVILIKKVSDRSINQYGDIPTAREMMLLKEKERKYI